jgi:hypothetical protein
MGKLATWDSNTSFSMGLPRPGQMIVAGGKVYRVQHEPISGAVTQPGVKGIAQ